MTRGGLAAYAALGLPLAMAMLPIYMLSPKFYGDALGVDLAALGAVLFLVRLMDTAQDPLIGRLVDFLHRRKSGWTALILAAAVGLAGGFLMLFNPPAWGAQGLLAWLALSLVIVYTAHSLANVCYLTWGARLTDDPVGRTRVTAWREAFGLGGVVFASVLPAAWASADGARAGYAQFAWVFVGVLAVGLLVTLWGAPRPAPEKADALEHWREALAPAAIRRLLWFYLFNATSVAVPATLVLFVMDDALGLQASAGLFLGLYFFAGLAALPGWVALSDRIGKERAWLVGALLASGALLMTASVGQGDEMRWAIVCLLSGTALGADLALPPAMLADAIGPAHRRSTGLYFGFWALVGKLSLALAAGLALPLVRLLGYQPGDASSAHALTEVYILLPVALKVAAGVALWLHQGPLKFTRAVARTKGLS